MKTPNETTNTPKLSPRHQTLTLILAALCFTSFGNVALAEVPIRVTSDLNVRSCPSSSCAVQGVLPAGSCQTAFEKVNGGNWVKIRFRGGIGFVSARYTRPGCGGPPPGPRFR